MLAKAALISFSGGFPIPPPTIIVFQYNPAELQRSLQQQRAATCGGGGEPTQAEAFRIDGPPRETISFKAEFNSDDLAMDGNPIAPLFGVRPALGSLELLLYPKSQQGLAGALGAIASGIGGSLSGGSSYSVPPDELPVVLFVWGPGRVLPVRLTALTIRELEFDNLLNPIRAEVDLSLEILKRLPSDHAAYGVYKYTENQMRTVAQLQLINNAQSVLAGLSLL
jgi:hypothetical protein